MVDGVILPVCFICGKVHKEGMHGGIYIKGKFICFDCEAEICNLQAKTPDYPQKNYLAVGRPTMNTK